MRNHSTPADGKRVLVVDDERDILSFVQDALTDEGYAVDTAASGEEALQSVMERRPDLIMLDVNLPGVDGWEVLSRLRAAAGEQTPVVVMTGGYRAQEQALASGAQGYLGKPFDLDDLISSVAAHAGLPMQGAQEVARHSSGEP
jgi:DNA-binding response OmpR family regulator